VRKKGRNGIGIILLAIQTIRCCFSIGLRSLALNSVLTTSRAVGSYLCAGDQFLLEVKSTRAIGFCCDVGDNNLASYNCAGDIEPIQLSLVIIFIASRLVQMLAIFAHHAQWHTMCRHDVRS
jgi:hypothetical protein